MANFRDGYLERKAEQGKLVSTTQLLADNQSIVLSAGQGVLYLTSDNTTATNRTFTISNGDNEGQRLTIILTSATANACELANTGNVKLSAGWTPATQYSNISLIFDGTNWIETSRVTGA